MFSSTHSNPKLYSLIINTHLLLLPTYTSVLFYLCIADAYDNLIGFITKMDLTKNKAI